MSARGWFAGEPDFHREGRLLVLDAPLVYHRVEIPDKRNGLGLAHDLETFTVPAGFPSDLASVPKILSSARVFFGSDIETAAAAILHDYLYASGLVSRARADAIFYEALRADGQGRVAANVMWLGVRLGGWLPWRHHRKAAK